MGAYDVRGVEAAWRRAWDDAGCHRATMAPQGERYFVHDAAPFPNGGLHLGHVRTYVIGDVTARYQRSLGKQVLYHTGFDAFGLPIELEAIDRGVAPRELVRQSKRLMTRQLRRLGISYDWSLVPDTSDPACYRWTQWLFLEMFDAGIVKRRNVPLQWCPSCRTSLARLQVEEDRCWRCRSVVEERRFPQWFILVSRYAATLRESLPRLDGWSDRAKAMIAGLIDDPAGGRGGHDWNVSRQRSWGTPIPLVHCAACGIVAVPRSELPVRLPDDLEWTCGSGALSRCSRFAHTPCPSCLRPARRETDTLDCFFDDIWCFMQALVLHGDPEGFDSESLGAWLPVDRCQSGLDTFYYFHLYRFLGLFLAERGLLRDPVLIRSFIGSGLVLAQGRKMSKHLGNAVCPDSILDAHGADALRLAILWAAGPQRDVDWKTELLDKARAFLDASYGTVRRCRGITPRGQVIAARRPRSRSAEKLRRTVADCRRRVAGFIEDYRPNAALEILADTRRRIERFASARVPTGRLATQDRAALEESLDGYVLALSPFAPHLAEELWHLLGHDNLACTENAFAGAERARSLSE